MDPEIANIKYPVYTGKSKNVITSTVKIPLNFSKKEWKKMANDKGESKWFLQPVDTIKYDSIQVLLYSKNIPKSEIEYQSYEVEILNRTQTIEWHEVICGNRISPTLIANIQQALIDADYLIEDKFLWSDFDKATKSALSIFQKTNGLPMGAFDLKTLEALGVKY